MTGILYGLGIGPGDPELITLKTVRLMKENNIIAIPGRSAIDSVAYRIAVQAVPEIEHKKLLPIDMPMTKDPGLLQKSHSKAADDVEAYLQLGENVVFLTLGDPTVYSTYLYLHKQILKRGYEAQIVSGITSFCASAARMNIGLAEQAEELHIIPASYQIDEALALSGTKVLMKAGRKIAQVKKILSEKNLEAVMIENCGMPNEKIYQGIEEIPEDAGYYSLIIIKEKTR